MSRTRSHGYKAKDRNGINDNWYKNEPKLWRKMTKHKKRRAALRQALHQAACGDADATFPLDRKPHEYYW